MSNSLQQINEGTTGYVTVVPKNKSGVAEPPSGASYRVDDVFSNTEIKAVTTLTPSSSIEIVLSPADNRIVNSDLAVEKRRITVVCTYSATDQVTAEYTYLVVALKKVSGNPPVIASS